MGEEEANTKVGKTVGNGSVPPTKPDNVVSENTKDESKVDKVDAINDSKEETESEAMEVDEEETANENKIADLKEKEDKGSKKQARKNNNKATPVAWTTERPVRERKSVERLVAVIEKDTAREFHIEKGRGTALKDIPNVAYKLSKKKVSDDALKLLHTVLFGRRGKALLVKSNILRFSGFVWHENEEKQKAKVQEKLDKYKKEKLFEFCDLLDIPIAKTSAKKEDVVVKLIDFLLLPHITTSELVSEKEQPSKRKKSASTSSKKQKSKSASEEHEGTPGSEEEEEEHEKVNGGPEKSESEGESESGEGEGEGGSKKRKRGVSKNKSKQKESKVPTSTSTSTSRKKPSTPKKSASGKKEEKQKPSNDELKAAVCEILKQVDFNTATFTDILKLLGKQFNTDLTPRKVTIKLMIQDELTKLADDNHQGEEGEAVKRPT